MDESFSPHYQMRHLNSVITTSYLKGGVLQKYRGAPHKYRAGDFDLQGHFNVSVLFVCKKLTL